MNRDDIEMNTAAVGSSIEAEMTRNAAAVLQGQGNDVVNSIIFETRMKRPSQRETFSLGNNRAGLSNN